MEMVKKGTRLIMSQVMLPSQANVAGNVHGGEIIKLMDSAAGAIATKFCRSNVVTARVDELEFHLPIYIGALVTCTATIAYAGKTSLDVFVEVTSENLEVQSEPQKALSAYFTMVSLDKAGNPQRIPDLNITSIEEKELYDSGKRIHRLNKEKHRR